MLKNRSTCYALAATLAEGGCGDSPPAPGGGSPAAVASVTVSPSDPTVAAGLTQQLSAALRDAAGNVLTGRAVTWASDNQSVATVSETGIVRGEAAGATVVTATSEGKRGSANVTVRLASFSQDVQPMFTANCTSCHSGSAPPQGLDLSSGAAYANLVNVRAVEANLLRIAPFKPDESYLVHKLQGTQASVGGSGARMPVGGALSQQMIDLIRAWITAGAPNN